VNLLCLRSIRNDSFLEIRPLRISVLAELDVKLAVAAGRALPVGVDPARQRLDGRHDIVHGAKVQDRGRLLELGLVHDREVVVLTRLGIDRNGGVDEDPVAIHEDADAPLRALSSSERREMSKIST
jgi:hypothetical protein